MALARREQQIGTRLAVLGTMLASEMRDEAPYRTLGANAAATRAGDSIAVMFDPAMTEGEIRRLLGPVRATAA